MKIIINICGEKKKIHKFKFKDKFKENNTLTVTEIKRCILRHCHDNSGWKIPGYNKGDRYNYPSYSQLYNTIQEYNHGACLVRLHYYDWLPLIISIYNLIHHWLVQLNEQMSTNPPCL